MLVGAAAVCVGCDSAAVVAPTQSTLTLVAADTTVPLGGSTAVTARVVELAGTAVHDGTVVTFSATLGSVYPDEAATVRGRATATFTAGSRSGVAEIRAYSGDAISEPVQVTIGAAAVGSVRLTAQPGSLPAAGGTAELAALVLDTDHNPLPAVPVAFSASAGALRAATARTDGGGTARTALTTTTTAEVTASAGGVEAVATVTVDAAATITITPAPDAPVAGQTVSFALAIDSGTRAIERAAIDFGDGATAELGAVAAATVTHAYQAAGAYTVTVTARDVGGHAATASIVVQVAPAPAVPIEIAANPAAPVLGQAVTFTVTVSPPPGAPAVRDVQLDFGDGSASSLGALTGTATAAHVYEIAGTYLVAATLDDALGRRTASSISVQVLPAPNIPVTISASPAAPVAGSPVTFTVEVRPPAGAAPVREVTIDFGDGSEESLGVLTGRGTVAHVYDAAGSYIVTATVEDAAGRRSASSLAVQVLPAPNIPVEVTANPVAPVAGSPVTFTVEVQPPAGAAPVREVTIDFGDGSEESLGVLTGRGTIAHVYHEAGSYIVTVTVHDASGHHSDSSVGITVSEGPSG